MAPDSKSTYDPPIPSYDEAVGTSTAASRDAFENEAWTPTADDGDEDREGHSLLRNAAPNATANRPDRHRSGGYRAPTVETDDDDSIFGAQGGSDTDDEAGHVRREMFEMDMIDAEHDDDRSSNFSALLWGKRIGFPLSLPRWRWSWRPRLPRMQIRLGQDDGGGARSTSDDAADEGPAPPRWKRWCFPLTWPEINNMALLMVVGRLLVVMIVLGFLYLLFFSDLFTGITRRMGSQMFDPESVRLHVQSSVDPLRMRENLREFTRYPHIAGTEGDYGLALDTRSKFVSYGLEDITVDQYWVYLNYPTADGRAVEILGDNDQPVWSAGLEEMDVKGPDAGHQTFAFHGHSKSGDVKGPLIYVNYGSREDFKTLQDSGIDTRGAIALVRYRSSDDDGALKVKAAEMAGFAGCLIYTDPADDGFLKGGSAPEGRWMPRDGVLRQAVSLTNWVVGDPLTPGWESVKTMPRLAKEKSPGLVQIPSLPLSWGDAEVLLSRLRGFGQRVNEEWVGGVPTVGEWWTGNLSSPIVRLKNEQDEDEKKSIWNVYGRISGVEQSSKSIIIGNHRDAWTLGATDPGSGTAVFLELARIFGDLLRRGWRPLRTIEFMSWDAEEYNLAGSTEFVEKNTDNLRDDAMVYINLDMAVTGSEFHASGSPVFRKLLLSILNRVSDPNVNTTIRDLFGQRHGDIEDLGYDSDYVAFQDIAGTSSLDLAFTSQGAPSFSAYDNFEWMETVGDPGFVYHTLLGQIVGLLALELADRPILPFDMSAYAGSIGRWVDELQEWSANKGANQAGATPLGFAALKEASAEVTLAVHEFEQWELEWESRIVAASGWESNGLGQGRENYNNRMAHFETKLLDLEQGGGIPNRTQFKHVIFGPPLWSADDGVHFPAIRDAILAGDWTLANQTVEKVAKIIRDAGANLWQEH
ncbi:Zn-dependent exopeptidase [Coniochaeta ligniaria NRRL 30616]|uniref:Zn-dependent exopeptidase n=1 Tax=Coniochaeta ligniaria NRRL 30616 TaxID=1408157 RepID=A0A1J7ILC6_9PEZI|nr:Zn-dependent exopeptidase [Coniochaeta ligniaria NRRL 30616]